MTNTDEQNKEEKRILTHTDLARFKGSESFYPQGLSRLVYTEGVKYLADNAGAYWLIDLIASYQHQLVTDSGLKHFQLWIVTVPNALDESQTPDYPFIYPQENHDAVVSCWRDSPVPSYLKRTCLDKGDEYKALDNYILSQDVLYTDFPLRELCLYVCGTEVDSKGQIISTLMLRSEY